MIWDTESSHLEPAFFVCRGVRCLVSAEPIRKSDKTALTAGRVSYFSALLFMCLCRDAVQSKRIPCERVDFAFQIRWEGFAH